MTCEHIVVDGKAAIICSRGRRPIKCVACGGPGDRLCDWKVEGGTCDRGLCVDCSFGPAHEKDLCPEHARAFKEWRARQ